MSRSSWLWWTILCGCSGVCYADEGALPVGDHRISDRPQRGMVFVCPAPMHGGGAQGSPWIRGNVWYPHDKLVVGGKMAWPGARVDVRVDGEQRVLSTNGLPMHETGAFPISSDDAAFRYDRNPNRIEGRNLVITFSRMPLEADEPSCLPMGAIGYALTGAAIFSALDGEGRDAVAHETQDRCNGHPSPHGEYHYHGGSPCMVDAAGQVGQHSDLVGYALDGFGIYGPYGERGAELSNDDLDTCHGHRHFIDWDGKVAMVYHYHVTKTYPYMIGCFKGTPAVVPRQGPSSRRQGRRPVPPRQMSLPRPMLERPPRF